MPGLGVAAAKVAGKVAASPAARSAASMAGNYVVGRGQQLVRGQRNKEPKPALRDMMGGKSWWQSNQYDSTKDWRQIGDFSVSRGKPRQSAGLGRQVIANEIQQRLGAKAAPGAATSPSTSTAMAGGPGASVDLGRRFHFLHGVGNVPGASGEVGGMRAIGPGPHPRSNMRFGEGKPFALDPAAHTLTNVREGESPWFPGVPDAHLPRAASFELGRGALALPAGRQVIDTTATSGTPRRKPGMNPIKHAEITQELTDVAARMEQPLTQPVKKRKAGANPAAIRAARAEWPKMPGQPTLGL